MLTIVLFVDKIEQEFKKNEQLFMIKTEEKIMELLALNPYREYYGSEIAREVKCSKASVSGILGGFLDKKIIKSRAVGNLKFYQINQSPILANYKISLVIKKLEPIVEKLKKISTKVVLFGSSARGEQTVESDIDLLVISKNKEEVRIVIGGGRLKNIIKPIIKTNSEWSEMEINDPEFFGEVNRGIVLHSYVSRI